MNHLTLSTGALLLDYTPPSDDIEEIKANLVELLKSNSPNVLETCRAGVFRATPLVRNACDDARRTPDPAMTLLDGWRVTLSSHFTTLAPGVLEVLLPWAEVESHGRATKVTAPDTATGLEPAPRIAWVGQTSIGLALIALHAPVHAGGLTISFLPGDRGDAPFELRAHSTAQTAPFELYILD